MQHWFSHIYILTPNKAEFPLYTGSFYHATMPHIFWNAPIKFWTKRWEILTQPRNTYFWAHITNFLTKLKKLKKLTQQRNTVFNAYIDFLKKKKSWKGWCNNWSFAIMQHWFWTKILIFLKKKKKAVQFRVAT